jgi:hemerythrin superfamily protein
MKVTDVLKKDHRKVEDLFEQVEDSSGAEREAHAETIFLELQAHTEAEEQVFYPAIREAAGDDIVDESIQEHHVVDVLMAELKGIADVDADEWTAKLTVMKENVEHHVEEEEQEMFPDVEAKVDHDRLEQIGAEVQAFKLRFKVRTLNVDELREMAAEADISGRSDMNKDDLVEALCAARVPVPT